LEQKLITYPGKQEKIEPGDLVILGSFSNARTGMVVQIVNEKSTEPEALVKVDRNFCWRLLASLRKLDAVFPICP
jgi:hypothetical protein